MAVFFLTALDSGCHDFPQPSISRCFLYIEASVMHPTTSTSGSGQPEPKLTRQVGLDSAVALNMLNMVGIGPFVTLPARRRGHGRPAGLPRLDPRRTHRRL